MRRFAILAALLASPAGAEVVTSGPNAFEVRRTVQLPGTPAAVWGRLGRIGSWWSPAHTYGGRTETLSLSLEPGGCFCERLAGGGGIEHMRVAHVAPRETLTLTGALGPLLGEAVAGVLEIKLVPSSAGTRMTATYRAAGFARGNAAQLAPAVDGVLGEQWARLAAEVARR